MLRQLVLATALLMIAAPAFSDTGIRGLEIINGKMYASSEYRMYVVAEQTALPIHSVEVKINDGPWTTYAGDQLCLWCEGGSCSTEELNACGTNISNQDAEDDRRGVKTRGSFSIATEGMHTVTTRATDILGNRSRENREVIFIDNTAPESAMNAYYFMDQEYDMSDLDEPEDLDEELVENAEAAFTRDGNVYVGPAYALHLEAYDMRSGVRTIQYRFGTGDTEWVTVRRESLSEFEQRDPCVETEREMELVEWGEDAFSMFYALITSDNEIMMSPGWNILEVRLQDMVYNCSDVIAFPIYYDTYAPEARVIPEIDFPVIDEQETRIATVDNQFIVTASDAGSGVDKIQIALDYETDVADFDNWGIYGEDTDTSNLEPANATYEIEPGDDEEGWHEYIRPISFSTAGYHRIWVRTVDNVGNPGIPYYFDVEVVITPPDTELRGGWPSYLLSSSSTD